MSQPRVPDQELTIAAGKADRQYWRDLWTYRDLFFFLCWRDVTVRYKQAVLGVAWAGIRPLVTVVVLAFVFGRVAGLSSGGSPYGLYVLAAMVFWQMFSAGLTQMTTSLVMSANIISKVYFPRLLMPASALATTMVDFVISTGLTILLGLGYGITPTWRLLGLLPLLALCLILTLGVGLWAAALNVRYRDFSYLVPFVLQTCLYASPVGYGSAVVPARWQLIYRLNPLVGVIEGSRWCLLNEQVEGLPVMLAISAGFSLIMLITGLAYFRATERSFADVI